MVKLSDGWGKLRLSKFLLPGITVFFTSLGGCTRTGRLALLIIAGGGVEAGDVAVAAGFD